MEALPAAGSKVQLRGLVKASEYNGKEGTVKHSHRAAAEGRVCVVLDESTKELSFKPENVEVLVDHIARMQEARKRAGDVDFLLHDAAGITDDGANIVGVHGSFDWIVDYKEIEKHLSQNIPRSARILQVGCGTSELSEKLYDAGFHEMTNVDIDEAVIEEMRRRHQEVRPKMKWLALDMTDTSPVFSDGECFEVALDKGTLDALLCTDDASALFCEVARLLTVGGTYIVISFRARGMLERFLQVPDAPFTLRCERVETPPQSKNEAHIFFLQKTACIKGCALEDRDSGRSRSRLDLKIVKAYQDSIIEWWHREQDPLLTPRLECDITRQFRAKLREKGLASTARLPLETLHTLLFNEAMRSEYGYDLDSFRSDVEAFVQEKDPHTFKAQEMQELQQDPATFNPQDSGGSDRRQGGKGCHALGGGVCAPLSLNLEEALEFLREMQ